MALMSISFAEEAMNPYPFDISVRVYPQEIHYGDPCFLTFSVSNQGSETVFLAYGKIFLRWSGIAVHCPENDAILSINSIFLNDCEGTMPHDNSPPPRFPVRPVKPGETMEFHVRMLWLPLLEFAHNEPAKELLQLTRQDEKDFSVRCRVSYREACLSVYRPRFDKNNRFLNRENFPADGFFLSELESKGYDTRSCDDELQCTIRIRPRSEEELKLLQDWYLELPTTALADQWTMEHIFAHPYHVNGSPFKMESPTPFELGRKREPFNDIYRKFFTSLETRTPESLARIKRTNELATQILTRAKQPNTTVSQNLVEFIQLRSFLVDMRYSENEKAEKVAFEKLTDFVEKAKDKELWIKFLDEIGFYGIANHKAFPYEKAESYRKLFGVRFGLNVLPQYVL